MAGERANTMVARPIYLRTRSGFVQLVRIVSAVFYILLCLNHAGVDSRPQSSENNHHRNRHHGHEDGSVRLVGGELEGTGNVLIYHDGEWGAVCDDGWNLRSATIICKSIGHPYALGFTNQAYFGVANHSKYIAAGFFTPVQTKTLNRTFAGPDQIYVTLNASKGLLINKFSKCLVRDQISGVYHPLSLYISSVLSKLYRLILIDGKKLFYREKRIKL